MSSDDEGLASADIILSTSPELISEFLKNREICYNAFCMKYRAWAMAYGREREAQWEEYVDARNAFLGGARLSWTPSY